MNVNFSLFAVLAVAISPLCQAQLTLAVHDQIFASSPFSIALDSLQKKINYTFKNNLLLRRAMTHSSFSKENNKALSVLGGSIIESSTALRLLEDDVDTPVRDLHLRMEEISKVESTCLADGMRLGLQSVVRVSVKTDPSAKAIVCGAYRAIFGAIAVDTNKADVAGSVFWNVHEDVGQSLPL